MADLLRIHASKDEAGFLSWTFVDDQMRGYKIALDGPLTVPVGDGDVWHVELVSTKRPATHRSGTATVRLVACVRELEPWQKLTEIPNFWIDPDDLHRALIWLHSGTNVILIGPPGTGKTTFSYRLAKALRWQHPCKVDITTLQKSGDLFGIEKATKGSTFYVASALSRYIERAHRAHREGLRTFFVLILDEVNRIHSKINDGFHGLFDDTHQVTITTSHGPRVIELPPNLVVIGTMNEGADFMGTYALDRALKDRFAAMRMKPMPEDAEVKILVAETGVLESQAMHVVRMARRLREASANGVLSFAPSYRGCRMAAQLVVNGLDLQRALVAGLLGWYEGDASIDPRGQPVAKPGSPAEKALSALQLQLPSNSRPPRKTT